MTTSKHQFPLLLLSISAILVGCGGSAQPGTSAPKASATGSETQTNETHPPTFESQVAQGATLYASHCARCHGDAGEGDSGPALVGKSALPLDPTTDSKHRKVQFGTALDVFVWVKEFMPAKKPGSLTDGEYVAILAFALKANGVQLDQPLDGTVAAGLKLH